MARARVRGGWRALAVGALVAPGVACSLVTSLSGLTGGPLAANDAGPEGAPSTVVDSGGAVVPGDDAGLTEEASTDAATNAVDALDAPSDSPPDGPPSAYCASLSPSPLFCDDFDEDPSDAAALVAPWDKVTGTGGSVARTSKIFTSPSLAMLVVSDANAPSIDLCGYKSFTTAPTAGQELLLAFDLDVVAADTVTASSDAILAAIELIDSQGNRWALQLEVAYGAAGTLGVNLSENSSVVGDASSSGYTPHPVGAALPIGAWTRVTMGVKVAADYTASVQFGSTTLDVAVTPHVQAGALPQILVGGTFAERSPQGWSLGYDDVTFDLH